MLKVDRIQWRSRWAVLATIAVGTIALATACGGGGDDPTAVPEPTPGPTEAPAPTATSQPAPTAAPDVQPTAAPTAAPAPDPTSTPEPTATPVPTQTPTPVVSNSFDAYGFTVKLDQDSDFASSNLVVNGWTEEAPSDAQGLMTFTYNGADTVIYWEPENGNTPSGLVGETFQLVKLSSPELEITAISEGELTVDGQAGAFGGFVFADAAVENAGGGLIGAWTCPGSGTSFSLTTRGEDATALQIRFDRLISGFECGI